jgi:hypothetical protein
VAVGKFHRRGTRFVFTGMPIGSRATAGKRSAPWCCCDLTHEDGIALADGAPVVTAICGSDGA